MPISDIVNITISTQSVNLSQAGFGTPLILTAKPSWTERQRTYTSLDGMVTDGFTTSDPEYKMAAVLFSQNPRPPSVKLGRLALKPTHKVRVTVTSVQNSTVYSVKVNDTVFSFTSDASATNDEIVAGLVAAIGALSGFAVAAVGSAGSQTLDITASAAGNSWCSVEVVNNALLKVEQITTDPGVATDLAAINLESSDWYFLLNPWNSTAIITAAATWVESNGKIFVAASNQTEIITVTAGSATDIAKTENTANHFRTSVWYHPDPSDFLDAAIVGRCAPLTPGTETWWGKSLSSVAAVTISATHRTNLRAKMANTFYTVTPGANMTFDGKVAGNEYIDVIRYRDKLQARIGERVITKLLAANKVPFTDPGVAVIEGETRAELIAGERDGALREGQSTVSVPKVADVSTAERAARLVPDVKFTAQIAGAIQAANINGVISV
jgi:hypothetical protein